MTYHSCGRCGTPVPEWDADVALPDKRVQRASYDPDVYHFECVQRVKYNEWKELLAEHNDVDVDEITLGA